MLKLKYLFDNRDLCKMILENWDYDPSSLDLLDYYRISSNAVYPFKYDEKVRILRFSPCSEKDKSNIIGELEFIRYLDSKGYPALHTIKSKDNKELLEVHTPWGDYFAVVFDRVAGIQLDEADYNFDICRKHGRYLGRLHKLSSEYKPLKPMRHSYEDVLTWAERELLIFNNEDLALKEVKLLKEFFSSLHKDDRCFGLVHYDFELDNIFYDEAFDTLNVIDFDDAMYHWYVMDVCQALDSVMNDGYCADFSSMKDCFIEGYREEFDISDDMLSYMPIFRRFANLYGYVRILISSAEVWDNEPSWLVELRNDLALIKNQRSKQFGNSIL